MEKKKQINTTGILCTQNHRIKKDLSKFCPFQFKIYVPENNDEMQREDKAYPLLLRKLVMWLPPKYIDTNHKHFNSKHLKVDSTIKTIRWCFQCGKKEMVESQANCSNKFALVTTRPQLDGVDLSDS